MLVGNPEVERSFRKHTCRLEDNIQMAVKEIECELD
jgi:hypothetical protein